MTDMIALLNDFNYIHPNNEQNEPTQGDIGETCNEPTQAKRNEFEELYASANEELYPGCDYVTRLDFVAKFTYFKVKGKLTDSIFNKMLEFFQHVFPTMKGQKLPPSYYAIKKTFKMIGLGYESIHACVNDCFLFRGDNNKDVHCCPVCKTSRWKDSNTPGKKVPKKVLRYFLIIPRLQRLYKSSHTAKEMTWHATGKCTEPGKMQHPVDGRAWKNFDTKYPNFAKEPRNVRLGLAADGFNPFGNLSQAYSMWPVILTTYNLPPWLCMKESSFMLTLLIPGPKSPGKDIDVYLRPLIDDLKVLWALKGVETIDVATGQKFNMRAMVLWTINDFPARSSLSGWSGQGYKACPTCNEDTPSVRVLGKTAYVGHRRFLKKPHKWRRSLEFNGQTDNKDPPKDLAGWDLRPNLKGSVEASGLKSHDCHIMMQRLLPYGLQNYLPDKIAKPIIDLCSLFKQICSATLMEDDMLKAQIKVALRRGGHLRPRWMYPFERYMKKLKGYVRNKAKPEGSIAEGYVAEEALTFSSHYFWDVTTKFNRPDRNVDPLSASVSSFRCCDLMSSADVARSHRGDGGGDDRPPSHVDAHETPLLVRDFYEEDNQHLQKAYNTNKASFKAKHWNADPTTGTYDVEAIRRARPEEITAAEWDKYIQFWNDPKNLARAAQNRQNWQKSVVISRQGSRSLARLRDEMGQASRHQDYHSNSLTTSGGTHTVDGVFPKDAGPPHFGLRLRVYPEDEIKCLLARRVVSFGRTIPGVGRVLPSTGPPGQVEATTSLDMFKRFWSGGARGVVGVVYDEDEWRMIEDDDGEEGRCVIYY
ncbi:hypothetical protein Tco_0653137 [Tanacetum coccineum]|uniref:DUF4218 domain-containing protein n=1 Tax=Tanacetum coccineum TaxID=301880 RepID=A0ABQ4WZU3_9ASTR